MKESPLARFERAAQRIVEGSYKRLFGSQLEPIDVANSLAQTMRDTQRDGHAADIFRVHLNPEEYEALLERRPRLSTELAEHLARIARSEGLLMAVLPQVVLMPDAGIQTHQVMVQAAHEQQPLDVTRPHAAVGERAASEAAAMVAVDAFLIVGGRRHVVLDQPLTRIGRRTDNDLVLSSARVSRQHAQIRWRYGRFVLYDVSQRGHTYVNGHPVREYVLQPGDVIALSDVQLVYGEGDRPDPLSSDGDTSQVTRPFFRPDSGT